MEVVKYHPKEPGFCPKKVDENQVVNSQSDVCGMMMTMMIVNIILNQQLQVLWLISLLT